MVEGERGGGEVCREEGRKRREETESKNDNHPETPTLKGDAWGEKDQLVWGVFLPMVESCGII